MNLNVRWTLWFYLWGQFSWVSRLNSFIEGDLGSVQLYWQKTIFDSLASRFLTWSQKKNVLWFWKIHLENPIPLFSFLVLNSSPKRLNRGWVISIKLITIRKLWAFFPSNFCIISVFAVAEVSRLRADFNLCSLSQDFNTYSKSGVQYYQWSKTPLSSTTVSMKYRRILYWPQGNNYVISKPVVHVIHRSVHGFWETEDLLSGLLWKSLLLVILVFWV